MRIIEEGKNGTPPQKKKRTDLMVSQAAQHIASGFGRGGESERGRVWVDGKKEGGGLCVCVGGGGMGGGGGGRKGAQKKT